MQESVQKTGKLWEMLSVQSRNHGHCLTSTQQHKHRLEICLYRRRLFWWPDLLRAKQIITVITVLVKDAGWTRGYNGGDGVVSTNKECDQLLLKLSGSLALHKEATGTIVNNTSKLNNSSYDSTCLHIF